MRQTDPDPPQGWGVDGRQRRTDRGQDSPCQAPTCDDIFNGPITITLIDEWLFLLLPLQLRDEVHLLPPDLGRGLGGRARVYNSSSRIPCPPVPLNPRPPAWSPTIRTAGMRKKKTFPTTGYRGILALGRVGP